MRQRLEEIYRQHRQGLYTLAVSITRCPGAAEDAVHEAFVRLWRREAQLNGDALTYVYTAVRNASVDQLRRAAAANRPATSIYQAQPEDPQQRAMSGEAQQVLHMAVESLPEAQRLAVVLKVYGELTFEQIAQVLGEPLPTVASRYRRALEALREKVQGLA